MRETATKPIKKVLPVLSMGALLVVLVLYLAAVYLSGGSAGGAVAFWLAFLVLVFCPGMFLCGYLLPDAKPAEKFPLATTMGCSVLMLAFAVFGRTQLTFLCALPGCILTILWIVKSLKVPHKWNTRQLPQNAWVLQLLFSAVLFLYIFSGVLPYAKPSAAGNMVYSQDMLWSVGNAASVRFGFPLRDIRTVGGIMHYHYFADAVQGLLALFSRQVVWDAVCYYSWPVWTAMLFLGLYAVSRWLGATPMLALLAPFGGSLLSFFEVSTTTHFFVNANNVIQSYLFLLAVFLVLQNLQKAGKMTVRYFFAFFLVMLALAWTKAVLAALLLCGLLAACVVWFIIQKKIDIKLIIVLATGAVLLGFLYATIYSGAIVNLVFEPSVTALKDVLRLTVSTYTPAVILYLVALIYNLRHFKTMSFVDLAINAMIPGGMLAAVLFNHYSGSESYFYLAAFFLIWLCAVRPLAALTKKKVVQMALIALCIAGGGATLYAAAPTFRHGVQTALRCVGARPSFPLESESITADDEAAAVWLRDNTEKEDVFATNRNARDMALGDGIFHPYTAFSQRQAFVESWRYAMDYSMEYQLLIHNFEEVSDRIFACESLEEAAQIARENGIQYLLLHVPTRGGPFADGEPVFETETTCIYDVG